MSDDTRFEDEESDILDEEKPSNASRLSWNDDLDEHMPRRPSAPSPGWPRSAVITCIVLGVLLLASVVLLVAAAVGGGGEDGEEGSGFAFFGGGRRGPAVPESLADAENAILDLGNTHLEGALEEARTGNFRDALESVKAGKEIVAIAALLDSEQASAVVEELDGIIDRLNRGAATGYAEGQRMLEELLSPPADEETAPDEETAEPADESAGSPAAEEEAAAGDEEAREDEPEAADAGEEETKGADEAQAE